MTAPERPAARVNDARLHGLLHPEVSVEWKEWVDHVAVVWRKVARKGPWYSIPAYSTSWEAMGTVVEAMREQPPEVRQWFARHLMASLLDAGPLFRDDWFDPYIFELSPAAVVAAAIAALEGGAG